jgi:pimeloyl-ACP methyl ester carboxylesterase
VVSAGSETPTLEERTFATGAGAIHAWIGGAGPALLLLHGAGPGVDAQLNWAPIWGRLAATFRVIAPDLLGFGTTELPGPLPDGASAWADARAEQTIAVLDALNLHQAHIVGNSAGGGAAGLRLIQANPERVGRAVLMGGAGTLPNPNANPAGFYDNPSPAAMELAIRRLIHDPERAPQPLSEIAQRRYSLAMRPGAEAAFRSMHGAATSRTSEPPEITSAPILLLHGAEDRVAAVEASLFLRAALGAAHLHIIPDAGHWIHVDQPHAFCGLVESFLSEGW